VASSDNLMQRPNERKRRKITDTAARLFASRPFHKVRLEDVAAAAQVGKGTLYVYFRGKEDLYASLLYDGLAGLVERIEQQVAECASPEEASARIVRELVGYAFDRPYIFELMRFVDPTRTERRLTKKRKELAALIEAVLRRGNAQGAWDDPHPELTAVFLPGLVRSAMLYGPKELEEQTLVRHILRLLGVGVGARELEGAAGLLGEQ
jgi:AcrR family transcriptional regulator